MHRLAQELIDEVIDWWHIADPDAMKPCGLVCKRWLPRSRYHLFSRVSLSAENLASFVDIVKASPLPILSCVHGLTLCYTGSSPDTQRFARLHSCPNIGTFTFRVRVSEAEGQAALDWLNSVSSLQDHLRSWGKNSSTISLLDLSIDGINTIPLHTILDLVSFFPAIRTLWVDLGEEAEMVDADAGVPPGFPVELKELSLNGSGTDLFLRRLLSLPIIPHLNHLIVQGRSPGDVDSIPSYFEQAGDEIDFLRVAFILPEADIVVLGKIFTYTTALKHISFICLDSSTALLILRLLPSSGLHFIKITFATTRGEEVPWQEYDTTLAEPRFNALTQFCVRSFRTGQSILTAETNLLMPLANARGILD